MKKIFRKNQLVITALALMIAVAGYFSYMNNNIDDGEAAAEASAGAEVLEKDLDISDEDYIQGEIFTDEGTGEETVAESTEKTASTDTQGAKTNDVAQNQSGDKEALDATAKAAGDTKTDVADTDGIENPGEAVLTSTTIANLDYAAEMKLNREQIRSKNKEALLEIVNNTTIADNLKQDAVDKMIALTDISEREAAAEMLLEAKGFTDVVVSIADDNCDVVLNMGEVTDAKRAQVEDIVKRKTNVSADKIVITPIVVEPEK